MRETLLPFSTPSIGEEEIAEMAAAAGSGWITTGPRTRAFEEAFSEFTGAAAALAVNSGTAAMQLALAALGMGRGAVVITTALTFCSGVHVIEQAGARHLLVDVEPGTLNIDPGRVEQAARRLRPGERLAAIMPVHLYGHPCDRDALLDIARKYHCALVEDAAHCLPGCYRGKRIGAGADEDVPVLTAFSFYANKNLTTGEGGMLTGSPRLIEEARLWSLHGMSGDAWKRYEGRSASWFYEVVRPGFKHNMTDIQAAIGMVQLRKLTSFAIRRSEIARRYNEAFATVEELQIPAHRPEVEHAWHVYALRLRLDRLTISREEFIEALRSRNISASVHFIPIHLHPWYRDTYGYRPDDFPVAYREYQRLVSLPIFPAMQDRDIQDVIDTVIGIVAENRKA